MKDYNPEVQVTAKFTRVAHRKMLSKCVLKRQSQLLKQFVRPRRDLYKWLMLAIIDRFYYKSTITT